MKTLKIIFNNLNKQRLDLFLSSELNTTRSHINSLVKNKLITVNYNLINKPGTLLKNNDEIIISTNDMNSRNGNNELEIKFNVIYEDDWLMVINKPKGLISHESSFHEKDTLLKEINQYYINNNYDYNQLKDVRSGLLHRLDKKTGGLVLIAKKRDIFNILKKDLEAKEIKRFYYALVVNSFNNDLKNFKIDLPLAHNNSTTKMVVSDKGKNAVTLIKILNNYKNYALVECELLTGRTHQIRAHLSAINHPIYDDEVYGKKVDDFGQYLFAYKIKLIHPVTKKKMEFELPKPEWLETKIKEIIND